MEFVFIAATHNNNNNDDDDALMGFFFFLLFFVVFVLTICPKTIFFRPFATTNKQNKHLRALLLHFAVSFGSVWLNSCSVEREREFRLRRRRRSMLSLFLRSLFFFFRCCKCYTIILLLLFYIEALVVDPNSFRLRQLLSLSLFY